MAAVYALLVGINAYPPPVPPLHGCVDDIGDVGRFLDQTAGARASVRTLLDGAATRGAVIDGFRSHLGRARRGDAALFWYCGHGATVPVDPAWWHLEPTGQMQTLVCVDSRGAGPDRDLLDKELAVLIGEVAAGGAHVVAVLDCCHAGGATRDTEPAGMRARQAPAARPDPAQLEATLRAVAGGLAALRGDHAARREDHPPLREDHVALAACRSEQRAFELPGRQPSGAFTRGLLAALRQPGEPRTYRELVAATRAYVEHRVDNQTPHLHPVTSPLVDQPFLGGLVRTPAATMTMAWHRDRWVVDAGSCHGLPAGPGDVRFAVHDQTPVREARLVATFPSRAVVEPVDWQPDRSTVYPVVLSSIPLPRVSVAVGGRAEDDPILARRILDAVRTAPPGARPSPHVRIVGWSAAGELPDLVVGAPASGEVTIETSAGVRLDDGTAGVTGIVAQLEHIAVWRRIRALENPTSRLADAVRLQVIEPRPGELRTPDDRDGLATGEDGAIELEYRPARGGLLPPAVFLRLDNTSDRDLFCVLLNLTDRFRIHASLFPGDLVRARSRAAVGSGELIQFSFPPGRELRRGAWVQDWLMLVVSEERIQPEHFALPRLGEPPPRQHRGGLGLPGLVERLALAARFRDADVAPSAARDWWTSITNVVTRVPPPRGPGVSWASDGRRPPRTPE